MHDIELCLRPVRLSHPETLALTLHFYQDFRKATNTHCLSNHQDSFRARNTVIVVVGGCREKLVIGRGKAIAQAMICELLVRMNQYKLQLLGLAT